MRNAKIIFTFLALMFIGFGSSKAQNQSNPPDGSNLPEISFGEILIMQGVMSYPTVQQQISAFETMFQPALEVIRNVDVTGKTEADASLAYYEYIELHPSIYLAFLTGYNGVGVPYLSRCLDDYLLNEYDPISFGFLPEDWITSGYSIK